MDEQEQQVAPFAAVPPLFAKALSDKGYESLTDVQAAVLAADANDEDLLVSAQTGSGKTVAFGLALAETLLDEGELFSQERGAAPRALIVAPTRELALQVQRELRWLYEPTGAKIASCVGGMDMRKERRALEFGAHIVVGTPGRLRDHLERGSFETSELRAVVLDEADEMLDMGFRDDLEFILDATPRERRTLLFSATMPPQIVSMAKTYQRNAKRISVTPDRKQHGDITYHAMQIAPNDRDHAIVNVLRFFDAPGAIIFCSTRAAVKHLTSRLQNRGFATVALSGELSQGDRNAALQALRDGRVRVCVATDVAARGIDLPNIDLVVHADLPQNKATLLHRSGRTGRAGRKGACVLLVPYNRRRSATRLLSSAAVKAEWAAPPKPEAILEKDKERILADEVWSEAPAEDDAAFIQQLLEEKGPELVAASYLKLLRRNMPSPEELIDTGPIFDGNERGGRFERGDREGRERGPKPRFDNGVWFQMSVGRKQNADPRWLLPLICRRGHVTKKDIGSIRILDRFTKFEIASEAAETFASAIQRPDEEDGSVIFKKLDGSGAGHEGGRGRGGPKGRSGRFEGSRGDRRFDKKPHRKGGKGGDSRRDGRKGGEEGGFRRGKKAAKPRYDD